MSDTKQKIAERLESVFSEKGFAKPSVSDLRDAAGVSLRTLYRYFPSRDAMVIGALKHRHARYLTFVFDDLPVGRDQQLDVIFDRIQTWMSHYAPNGCIFQNALAATPGSAELEELLLTHKREIGVRLAENIGLKGQEATMRQIHEGAIQSWIFQREEAIVIARKLTHAIAG